MRIGVLYNLVDNVEKGKDIEKIAENEVLEIAKAVESALQAKGHKVTLIRVNSIDFRSLKRDYDFIFNLAEGFDGDIQAEPLIAKKIKESGVPFTGCGEKALSLCLDKVNAKVLLNKAGIKTPRYQLFKKKSDKLIDGLTFPLIVKPVHEDASLGITKDSVVYEEKKLVEKIKEVIDSYKQPALVEEYIDGREINAALIGNSTDQYDDLLVLPLSEIIFDFPKGIPKIVTFEAKWIEDSSEFKGTIGKSPANLPEDIAESIRAYAKEAFKIIGCSDYARVDFRVRGNDIYALEVNPNPCINPNGAGFVKSAKAAGYSYEELINLILLKAQKRYLSSPLRDRLSFDSR